MRRIWRERGEEEKEKRVGVRRVETRSRKRRRWMGWEEDEVRR